MTAYHVLLISLLAFGVVLCRFRWGKAVYATVCVAAFTMLSGLRYAVGWDFPSYASMYTQAAFQSWDQLFAIRYEKGYLLLSRLLGNVSIDVRVIFYAVALLTSVSVMLYAYFYSSNLWMSAFAFVAMGFFYNSLCYLRQILAAMILMWALRYISEGRFCRFACLVLLAGTFHFSALLFLLFYFLLRIPVNRFTLPLFCVGAAVCYVQSNAILGALTHLIYRAYDPLNSINVTTGLPWEYFAAAALLCMLFLALRSRLVALRPLNQTLINCAFLGALFDLIAIKHSIISRMGVLIMIPTLLLLLPDVQLVLTQRLATGRWALSPRYARLVVCGVMLALMVAYHQILINHNYNGVVPYQTWRGAMGG